MENRTLYSMFACRLAFAMSLAFLPFATKAAAAPRFNMVVIAELLADGKGPADDQHRPYVEAAKVWLNQLAKDSNFTVAYLTTPDSFTDAMLANVDLIWQMNYAPYGWPAVPKAAFEKYMNAGKGGWIGVHHASLYGPVITQETWPYFAKLIGEVNYKNYISKFASGNVRVESAAHPVMLGVPPEFNVSTEEWYTWDKNPRPKVTVLANLDESSMKFVDPGQSGTKMGDHPVVWTYEGYKSRNLYIFMGHHPNLFQNQSYMTLLRNSIFWAVNKPTTAVARPLKPARAIAVRADQGFITLPGGLRGARVLDAAGHELWRSGATERIDRIDRAAWGAGRYLLQGESAGSRISQWIELD
jgi:uncharacterized protein